VSEATQPWRSPETVARLAAEWHARLSGHHLVRLAGGPGWLRLTLVEDIDRTREDSGPPAHLYLIAMPVAVCLWDTDTVTPGSWDKALGRVPQKQLTPTPYLKHAILESIAASADDRIVYLTFTGPDGKTYVIAHQLFGPRGNLVLADARGRRLWSAHPSPHSATLAAPPPPVEAVGSDVAPKFREVAPQHLYTGLRANTEIRARTALRRALDTATRRRDNLARDLDKADRGDEARKNGETLAIHLHALNQGPDEVVLVDAEGVERTITLDSSHTPVENMEAYFKQARKADRGRETIAERLENASERVEKLKSLDTELTGLLDSADDPLATVPEWRESNADLLGEAPRPGMKRRVAEVTLPFRRYRLDDRWDVWVGRHNKENDTLTHKASSPDDWWFHAQGVAGSHVILRTGGQPDQVPRSVLAKAASIAAYHSKARTSGLAPVVYTLRKYVRKPRKSPAGTASCIREKSLMVEPGVPVESTQ
jgi:predicted ribosome quality control (RQC) complex YloA/Tae2 family protein